MKKTALRASGLVLLLALAAGCAHKQVWTKLEQRLNVLLLTLLLQRLLLKLHVLLLIALLRLLLLHKAPLIKRFLLQQKHRLAAKQTAKAWSVCSRNRCLSSTTT